MPGSACRHYVSGRCFYDERLNPGYDESLHCRFLVLWEREYDEFLDRAEAFSLDPQALEALWDRRFERLQREGEGCEGYSYSENGGDQGCANGRGAVCLLALPLCEGRCRRFALPEDDPESEYHDTDKER